MTSLDLEEMIQNLELERQRIEEALGVLRRLHQIRKPSTPAAAADSIADDGEQELVIEAAPEALGAVRNEDTESNG